MTTEELRRAIEAVLLVAVEPVPSGLLAELVEEPVDRVETICAELAADYDAERRGFMLARIAGGYRYQTHPDLAPYVERFANREVSHRLSTAALETLAIVAYRQPVTRAVIEGIRGVTADRALATLRSRELVDEVGRTEAIGRPILYGTTMRFLEYLGIESLRELPALPEPSEAE